MQVRHDMVTVFVARPDASRASHEFLQLKRAEGHYLAGTWQIVRGGVEPDETYIAGALRELREETALTPAEFYRLAMVESFYIPQGDTLWHSVAFLALVPTDAVVRLNDEHTDFRWIPRSNIDAETMWASERLVLASLLRDILDNGAAKEHLRVET